MLQDRKIDANQNFYRVKNYNLTEILFAFSI